MALKDKGRIGTATWLADMRSQGWEIALGSRRMPVSHAKLPTQSTYILDIPTNGESDM